MPKPEAEYDFGFSFESAEPTSKDEISDLRSRLDKIRKIFLPMLEKLSENPDKEFIRWPNRQVILNEQINVLKKLTDIN